MACQFTKYIVNLSIEVEGENDDVVVVENISNSNSADTGPYDWSLNAKQTDNNKNIIAEFDDIMKQNSKDEIFELILCTNAVIDSVDRKVERGSTLYGRKC